MLVSHRKKFIFTKTNKTAGISVESYFEPFCMAPGEWKESHYRDQYVSDFGIIGYRGDHIEGSQWWNHMSAAMIKEKLGSNIWNSYFKFTVVRNPFSKLVSAWYYYHKPRLTWRSSLKGFIKNPRSLRHLFLAPSDIANFRQWIIQGGAIIDRNKYLIDGQECINFFIRYENLEEDIKWICTKLDVVQPGRKIPRFKSGIRSSRFKIRDFYDNQTKEIVRKKYAWEFERFEYELT